MFARIVSMPLKPGRSSAFAETIDQAVVPLLRKHKGFLGEIGLVTEDGKKALGISFWDDKASADAYQRSGYAEVMKALDKVLAGPTAFETCEVTNSTARNIAPALVG